jgi:REP element-mobilizing transposase RayT
VVEVSSRTLQGRFLLRPSKEANDLILGVIGRAQSKYRVEIFAFIFMSNHFHILIRAQSAQQMARFVGFVKANIAKELGRLHRWREKFWGRRYHSASIADSPEAVKARFKYIASNSCKEGLVASPLSWPGTSSLNAMCLGESTLTGVWYDRSAENRATRKGDRTPVASVETVRLTPLPFLADLSAEDQRGFVKDIVREIESETQEMHRHGGTRPMGVRRIQRMKPHGKPRRLKPTPAPLFHFATSDEFERMRIARELRVAQYRAAAMRLHRGERDVQFPRGCFPPPAPFRADRAPPPQPTC